MSAWTTQTTVREEPLARILSVLSLVLVLRITPLATME